MVFLSLNMPKKQFLILYPDRSKDRVGCVERDSLLLAKAIRFKSGNVYEYVGEFRRMHSFREFEGFTCYGVIAKEPVQKYYPGTFIVEYRDGTRRHERLERPESLEMNLPARIAQLEAVGA